MRIPVELLPEGVSAPEPGPRTLDRDLYVAMTRARRRGIVSYPSLNDRGAVLLPAAPIERARTELSAAGVQVRSEGSEDLGLSPREADVAALVAAGRSNRETGAELYLSTKAVEYHLGNIFAKLGIRSRHELAARLSAAPVGDPPR